MTRPTSKTRAQILQLEGQTRKSKSDLLATEEPLEIRVRHNGQRLWQTITMRTPGHDFELAAGFLLSEGVLPDASSIRNITYCADAEQMYNTVNVETQVAITVQPRATGVSSACGVCGKNALEDLKTAGLEPIQSDLQLEPSVLYALPERLRAAQRVFDDTGGLHAAALFSSTGELLCLREDIGRHNAVDKLIGWAALNQHALEHTIMLVSGRAGYEIALKCIAARVPVLASISAPSSLAVSMAKEFELTLIGFLRGERCNVYSAHHRISS
jgi:FdhD protein